MEIFRHPLFLVSLLLFLLHQFLQNVLEISIPPVDAYLDNLLAMPLFLTFLVAERRFLFRYGNHYRLTGLEIIIATIYISIISEFLFPVLSSRFYYDPWDFLFFFAGAGLFALINKKKVRVG